MSLSTDFIQECSRRLFFFNFKLVSPITLSYRNKAKRMTFALKTSEKRVFFLITTRSFFYRTLSLADIRADMHNKVSNKMD